MYDVNNSKTAERLPFGGLAVKKLFYQFRTKEKIIDKNL